MSVVPPLPTLLAHVAFALFHCLLEDGTAAQDPLTKFYLARNLLFVLILLNSPLETICPQIYSSPPASPACAIMLGYPKMFPWENLTHPLRTGVKI